MPKPGLLPIWNIEKWQFKVSEFTNGGRYKHQTFTRFTLVSYFQEYPHQVAKFPAILDSFYSVLQCYRKAASNSRSLKCRMWNLIDVSFCSQWKIKSSVMGNKTGFRRSSHMYVPLSHLRSKESQCMHIICMYITYWIGSGMLYYKIYTLPKWEYACISHSIALKQCVSRVSSAKLSLML